ncbi:MAG TPA: hypothetical protein PKE69_16030 [Pyrinomonadaceae bacterium]|nr:hypothetical protein [Pyrinomonadaceae bacterium]
MKRIFQFVIIISSFLLINFSLVFGQEKTITKKEYTEITEKAFNGVKGKIHRSIYTLDYFFPPNPTPTRLVKMTREVVPPNKYRLITERFNEKREEIKVGTRVYVRENDGKWEKDSETLFLMAAENNEKIEEESYKLYEDSELNGEKVNLYEKVIKLTNLNNEEGKEKEIHTERYWIKKDGVLVKIENKTDTVGKTSFSLSTTIYEYDSTIKIEIPRITLRKSK